MNIRNDYSYLFNSLNNNTTSNNNGNLFASIDLSEYNSLKTGTYGKLLKAYYAENDDSSVKDTKEKDNKKQTLSKETEVEKMTNVSNSANTLQDSAEKLISISTKDSLFKEKELTVKDAAGKETKIMGYDTDAIYDAVKDFASKYNAFIKSVEDSGSTKLDQEVDSLTLLVSDFSAALEKVGVAIDKEDSSLSIDEKKFKAADIADLKKLFNGNASFTYKVSAKASMIGASAESEANTMKNYTSNGTYNQSLSSGSLLDSLI